MKTRPTCTAPARPTCSSDDVGDLVTDGSLEHASCCSAAAPAGCSGTDWPPLTGWQRYAAERAAGVRVPPSVSTWREADVRRQAEADAFSRSQATRPTATVPWGPGPSCEGRS